MSLPATSRVTAPTRATGGPHPGVVAVASLGLLLAGLVSMAALSGGHSIASPFSDTATVDGFFVHHALAARAGALLQLGSAIPLGIYAATTHARQQRLGIRVAGPTIGLFGGVTAAVLLSLSAIITWAQSQPVVSADPSLTHALAYISFGAGGFAHDLGLGLLVAGIAVPGLRLHLLPARLAWVGLALAVLAELSFLTMVIEPVQWLIPLGRFGSLLWLIVAGFMLPNTRPEKGEHA